MKTIIAHWEGAIPLLSRERSDVPAELDKIFQSMVAKKSEDRFQSMAQVVLALEELDIKDDEEAPPVVAGAQEYRTAQFQDTRRKSSKPVPATDSGKPPKSRWGLIAAGLCGLVVLLAGLIIRLNTPAGTIVLEIDQPELIGAVVTIDGEKKVTIKTGEGKQPIEVTPDKKRHELEIKIAGFETFSKEFTFETGDRQTIKVRLEPLDAEANKDGAEASSGWVALISPA